MSTSLKAWIAILLTLFLTFGSGCASLRSTLAAQAHAASAQEPGGHQRVGSRGEVAKWVVIGTILTFVVFVDLVILPATYHDPFPCCRAVVVSCH